MDIKRFFNRLGPGLLFASMAIGTSHLSAIHKGWGRLRNVNGRSYLTRQPFKISLFRIWSTIYKGQRAFLN